MKQGTGVKTKRLITSLALSALLLFTSCKGFFVAVNNNPGGGATSFVYVINQITGGTGTLAEYSMTTGVLTQLTGSPMSLATTPTSIVVAPNNASVYIGTVTGIFLYTVNSDGTLTEGNNGTVVYLNANLPAIQSMVMDSTSSWLIFTSQGSNQLDALAIDPTTGLPVTGNPVTPINLKAAVPANLTSGLAISPSNDNIFVALGADGVQQVAFSPTSATTLSSTQVIPVHNPRYLDNAVAVDTTSTFLYVAENAPTTTAAGALRTITIGSTFNKDSGDIATGIGPSAILPDASGLYVYVTNQGSNDINAYTLTAGIPAALNTTVALSTFPTCNGPDAIVEDSSKSYVLDIGLGNNPDLYLYSFDATSLGTLDIGNTTSTGTTNPSLANGIAVTH
jgi:6-phosphogluconolactonase